MVEASSFFMVSRPPSFDAANHLEQRQGSAFPALPGRTSARPGAISASSQVVTLLAAASIFAVRRYRTLSLAEHFGRLCQRKDFGKEINLAAVGISFRRRLLRGVASAADENELREQTKVGNSPLVKLSITFR
ncbi:hypothetical protein [Mycoplana ramosa]|uniref:Uncharacterized protein n=1 Tax=Mycoplana ramosa TaxID=40837 RepID=A0ABW3YT53_MYCRA